MAKTKLGGNQLRFSPDHAFTGSAGVTRAAIVDTAAGLVLSSSRVYLGQDPADNLEAATKQYVDSQTGGADVDKKQIVFGAADGSGFDSTENAILTDGGAKLGISGSALFGAAAAKRLLISMSNGSGMQIKVDGPAAASSNLTFDVAGDIILDADGGDLEFKDDGTSLLKISNSSSDVVLQPQVADKDIVFKEDGGDTVMTVDSSAKSLLLDSTNKIEFGDNATFIHQSTDGQLDIDADVKVLIDSPTLTVEAETAINLESDAVNIGEDGNNDVVLSFKGDGSDGELKWMEDEDYFEFSDDILMATTEQVQFGSTAVTVGLVNATNEKLKILNNDAGGDIGLQVDVTKEIHISGKMLALTGSAAGGVGSSGILMVDASSGNVLLDVAGGAAATVGLSGSLIGTANSVIQGLGGAVFEQATSFATPPWSTSFASMVISSSLGGGNESSRAPSGKGFSSIIPYVGSPSKGGAFGQVSDRTFFVTGSSAGAPGQQFYRDSVEVYVNGVRLMSGTAAEAVDGSADYTVSGTLAGTVAARNKDALAITLGGGVFVNGDVLTIQAQSRTRTG